MAFPVFMDAPLAFQVEMGMVGGMETNYAQPHRPLTHIETTGRRKDSEGFDLVTTVETCAAGHLWKIVRRVVPSFGECHDQMVCWICMERANA